jgi:deoxyribodipyrimidine photo-lyase
MGNVIWWVRRDLRLSDNPALSGAISTSQRVIPVFIIDPKLIQSPNASEKRLGFLWAGLEQLDLGLQACGSQLIVRSGSPVEVLSRLVTENSVEAVFAEADFSPYARQRDQLVSQRLPLHLVGGCSISHPEAVLKSSGEPYVVYSPYRRAWKARNQPEDWLPHPKPARIDTPKRIKSEPIPSNPTLPTSSFFVPGESAAHERLVAFTSGVDPEIYYYAEGRNRLDLDGTAVISPYLRFGMLSARQAALAAWQALQIALDDQVRKGAEGWLHELIWREFYIAILYHFPEVLKYSFRGVYRNISWLNNAYDFEAWCHGLTGYPIVDAAMRQLITTGWMHNRGRMIVASFLVKDLLIDWRWGERWFMQHLVDGDPAANNGGWQWTAGTGTDAAPYFRIFNPILQSKKYDPQGKYIRKWIPELGPVPLKYIHTPWEMSTGLQREAGCVIGDDYPAPIIEHSFARQRAIHAYKAARDKQMKKKQ